METGQLAAIIVATTKQRKEESVVHMKVRQLATVTFVTMKYIGEVSIVDMKLGIPIKYVPMKDERTKQRKEEYVCVMAQGSFAKLTATKVAPDMYRKEEYVGVTGKRNQSCPLGKTHIFVVTI